jgi:hypothetical protein
MTTTIAFPTVLETFFTERLLRQKRVSPHTIASDRDTFSLLRRFTQQRLGKAPSTLTLDDLDAPVVSAFLDDLEQARGTSPPPPQCPPRGDALVFPRRGTAGPEPQWPDPTGFGHPQSAR